MQQSEQGYKVLAVERLRVKADEFRDRAKLFEKQIAERIRWIGEAQRQEDDLRLAIAALEGGQAEQPQ